jgi:hypothetical protein
VNNLSFAIGFSRVAEMALLRAWDVVVQEAALERNDP